MPRRFAALFPWAPVLVLAGCPASFPMSEPAPSSAPVLGHLHPYQVDAQPLDLGQPAGASLRLRLRAGDDGRQVLAWAGDVATFRVKLSSPALKVGMPHVVTDGVAILDVNARITDLSIMRMPPGTYDIALQALDLANNVVNAEQDASGFAVLDTGVQLVTSEMTDLGAISIRLKATYILAPGGGVDDNFSGKDAQDNPLPSPEATSTATQADPSPAPSPGKKAGSDKGPTPQTDATRTQAAPEATQPQPVPEATQPLL